MSDQWTTDETDETLVVDEVIVDTDRGPVVEGEVTAIPLQVTNMNVGVLFLFAIAGTGIIGAAIGGYASDNKYSLIGGIRAASQMVSYEVALGLTRRKHQVVPHPFKDSRGHVRDQPQSYGERRHAPEQPPRQCQHATRTLAVRNGSYAIRHAQFKLNRGVFRPRCENRLPVADCACNSQFGGLRP